MVNVEEAVERADVLVLAVWFDAFRQLIARYGSRLAGKVIVDPTNPIGPDGNGGYRKVIGEQVPSAGTPAQEEVLAIAEKWRPYRSLATSYLFSAAFEPSEAPPVARHRKG